MSSVSFPIGDLEQHEKVVLECFSKLWYHSVDFMFIMAVEPNGEFSLYDNNPASKKVMGLDDNAVTHRFNIRETWSDEIVEGLYETYRNAIAHGHPISYEQYATLNDQPIFVDTLFVPIFDEEGNAQFVCGVSRDISKIKEAEKIAVEANVKLKEYTEALESINIDLDEKVKARTRELEKATKEVEGVYKAKSAFLSRMSHEIRTPVNAIVGLASMLNKTELTPDQQSYLDKILQAGQQLTGVVNDTLDLSKLEAGKFEVESVEFSPEQVMQQAVNMLALRAYEKKLDIAVSISANLPDVLIGDPLRIKQITINLLSNAIKFTDKGAITLAVDYDEHQACLHWSVKDTGKGISGSHIDKLFQSFNQLEASTSRHYGGTGLGLVISKQLSQLMGGDITVESTLGQGSCFSVVLPAPDPSARRHQVSNFAEFTAQRKILLLDQSVASGFALSEMLTDIGYDVEPCDMLTAGLAKALQSVQVSQLYHKVLIDVDSFEVEELDSMLSAVRRFYSESDLILIKKFGNEQRQLTDTETLMTLEKPLFRTALLQAFSGSASPSPSHLIDKPVNHALVNGVGRPNWSGYSLLVVDDNEVNQQVARGYLEHTGVSITTAMSGVQAIEILKEQRFDLVLMDINMPYMDGWETTSLVRQQYTVSELPIIALTAFSGEEVYDTCKRVGMSAHIGKPIVEAKLLETIGKFLSGKEDRPVTLSPISIPVKSTRSERLTPLLNSELLNIPLALQRLESRDHLLIDVLETFYRRYSDCVLLSKPFEISDVEFFSECHSLKSTAAYIGADSLLALCRKVDSGKSSHELRRQICESLSDVLKVIATAFDTTPAGSNTTNEESALLINVLLEQLSQSNFSAAQTVSRIRQQPWCTQFHQQQLDKTEALLEDVEFEEAYLVVKALFMDKEIS
ncbi:TPA: ATP-binding protein [Vibrio vulnificus]|uniref:ATP-binding protein n=1 Tax=Vibrio vulnificus TaxID=672 RepID=UPI0019D4D62E|nr:ATP-binding protein [Vibrio vulnificus]MBN8088779.1 response regulator [Vibrio vulnificus]MBN8117697.1 response regulator [Vibrio vulnificus]